MKDKRKGKLYTTQKIESEKRDLTEINELNPYPNPTDGTTFIEGVSGQEMLKIVISNGIGNPIQQVEIYREGLVKIDLSPMPAGIYFIKIVTKDDSKVFKLVKK